MITKENFKSAISECNENHLNQCLHDVMLDKVSEPDRVSLLYGAMDFACEEKKYDFVLKVFDFVKQHAISSVMMKELFQVFNSNIVFWRAANPTLASFIENIVPPYNSQKFLELDLHEEEDFLDPITQRVMDFPVILKGRVFNFDTLDNIEENNDGERVNPFDRQPFFIMDIAPAVEIDDRIKKKIRSATMKRKEIVRKFCDFSSKDMLDDLEKIVKDNPNININEDFMSGYTALHYACTSGKIRAIKWLLMNGADLDLKGGQEGVTPFSILKKKHPAVVVEIKDFLINFLQEGIKSKDAKSSLRYAHLLLNGIVLERDVEKGSLYLEKAGEFGLSEGYIECGDLYRFGRYGFKRNYELAISLYVKAYELYGDENALIRVVGFMEVESIKAPSMRVEKVIAMADQNNPYAQFTCSELFEKGLASISISKRFAAKYLKRSVEQGLDIAQHRYAEALAKGTLFKFNITEAARCFKMAADQGFEKSQIVYANFLVQGLGVAINNAEASRYYKLAADQGMKDAQHKYAAMCFSGLGIPVNKLEAVKYGKMAADQGVVECQIMYASIHMSGDGVPVDFSKAVKYAKMAADCGSKLGQYVYAGCLRQLIINSGGSDYTEVAKYFKMSADQGYEEAQYTYADLMFSGMGALRSYEEAAKYYKLAADQGMKEAQFAYASRCLEGKGIPVNIPEALKYFRMAADNGCSKSQLICQTMCGSVQTTLKSKPF